jgi:hypothetical protein
MNENEFKLKYLKYKAKYLNIKMYGGQEPKFIRKGTYGCTYMPSFKCAVPPIRPDPIPETANEATKTAYKLALNKYTNYYKGKISKMMNSTI